MLYYRQVDSAMEAEEWEWSEESWIKVDTIGAGKSFTRDMGKGGQGPKMDERTIDFGTINKNGFYLAFVDSGACLSLAGVKVYFNKCPATVRSLAFFPETPSNGEGGASLAEALGNCVIGAHPLGTTRLTLHCGAEGEWMVSSGTCVCNPGREKSEEGTECQGKTHTIYYVTKQTHHAAPISILFYSRHYVKGITNHRPHLKGGGNYSIPLH